MNTNEAKIRRSGARPGTANIEKVFAALLALGTGWYSRNDLARQLNKRLLNRSDLGAIDRLIAAKRIEARQVESAQGPMLLRWEYHIPGANHPARNESAPNG